MRASELLRMFPLPLFFMFAVHVIRLVLGNEDVNEGMRAELMTNFNRIPETSSCASRKAYNIKHTVVPYV